MILNETDARRSLWRPFLRVAAICGVTMWVSASQAEDWPRLLGPTQDNHSAETNLLLRWPEQGPPVLWRRALETGFSPPVVAQGIVIAFYRQANEEVVEGLEAATGEAIWRHAYATRYDDRYGFNGGPRSAPTIDGKHVYTLGAEGTLTCLTLDAGRPRWQRHLNKEFGVRQNFFGVGVSPLIVDDRILINVGATNGAGIVAFDTKTGRTLWTSSDETASYSTPISATLNQRTRAIFLARAGLVVIEPEDGRILGHYPFRARVEESVNAASPIVIGESIFISSSYRVGSALLKLGQQGLSEIWRDPKTMANHWATSIHHEGNIYGCDARHENAATLRCISVADGTLRWSGPTGLGRSTYIMAEGHLIAVGERGDLALIEVNPTQYIEKARVRLTKHPSWAPPALSNGRLYLRDETQLLCLDLRAR